MNAQLYKLELMEWLLKIQDLDILKKTLTLKKQTEVISQVRDLSKIKPMSIEQYNAMIDLAVTDAKEGKLTDMNTLKEEMKNKN